MGLAAGVLPFNRTGRFPGVTDPHESWDVTLQKIRRLIADTTATKP